MASNFVARLPRASSVAVGRDDGGETQLLDVLDDDVGDTIVLFSRHFKKVSSPLSRLDGTGPNEEGLITGWGIGCNLGHVE